MVCAQLLLLFNGPKLTSVDSWQWERRESLALDLPLLLQAPLGLQDWVLKLSPSVNVARKCKSVTCKTKVLRIILFF